MDKISSKYNLLQKASRTMFIAIAVAAVVVSFSLVSIKAIYSQISFNNKVTSAKEDVKETLKENKENLEELKVSFEALDSAGNLLEEQGERKNSSVILDALPIKGDLPALNTFMQNLAKETGVELTFASQELSSTDPFSPSPTPVEVPFSLEVVGNYKSLSNFLTSVDKVIRPLKINTMELSGSDQSLTATMTLSTYFQPGVLIEPTYENIDAGGD